MRTSDAVEKRAKRHRLPRKLGKNNNGFCSSFCKVDQNNSLFTAGVGGGFAYALMIGMGRCEFKSPKVSERANRKTKLAWSR